MLRLEHFLGKGATRLCFYHPETPDKCVKVAMRHKNIPQLQQELEAVKACRSALYTYLPTYHDELVETSLGPGIVCEIIKDDNGQVSPSLNGFVRTNRLNKRMVAQIAIFAKNILENRIPLYDFNPENFVIQQKNGRYILRFTDLKTYNRYKPWTYLGLERLIPAISMHIVQRRLRRLMAWAESHAEK